ncbi:molybdopterin-dependent oxidoreductase [Pandoraea pneumonica]|jgi:hypothetical protein|uniref:Molybdopterin-dependent oxidoreductase n=1 Tax=Pandoraea pneumonica TaxID=2508299 RepID=A0A5E4SQA7_9BURK|nr:molybdopterin-dependent oxidoreductase [Pandoraea pneumonica]VVD77152.1 molybdopterin-dependent oxidoreductase [Pandoraea pneumonica]
MKKREFLTSAVALGVSAPVLAAPQVSAPASGTTPLITVSGSIARYNRGPVDPALDQLFHKQLVQFEAAYTFDFGTLARMPAQTVMPSNPATQILLRALDGYVIATTLGQLRDYQFLLATHMDDKPLALGGLGPLWAVYDPAAIPALAGKPLKEQFTLCPWGVYHIQVNAVS